MLGAVAAAGAQPFAQVARQLSTSSWTYAPLGTLIETGLSAEGDQLGPAISRLRNVLWGRRAASAVGYRQVDGQRGLPGPEDRGGPRHRQRVAHPGTKTGFGSAQI